MIIPSLDYHITGLEMPPPFREKVKECVCADSDTRTLWCWWPGLCYREDMETEEKSQKVGIQGQRMLLPLTHFKKLAIRIL